MTFSQWLGQLQFDQLLTTLVLAAAALLAICLHELSHGYVAYLLGDPTAKRMGRLNLNPLRHIDPLGLILMITARFGWAKPVPIDPRYFKNPKRGMAITALAGPLMNMLLTALGMTMYCSTLYLGYQLKYPAWFHHTAMFFYYFYNLIASLAMFNLLPVPPLDGSKVVFSILPNRIYDWILRYERYGMLLLAVLIWVGVLNGPLGQMQQWFINLLWPLCDWPLSFV